MAHYERDKDDHRVFDGGEDEDDGEGSQLPVVIIAAILVLAAFGGVVWLAYNQGVARGRGDAPPRIAMSDTVKSGGDSGLKVYQDRAAGEEDDSAKPAAAPSTAAANQIAQAAPSVTPAPVVPQATPAATAPTPPPPQQAVAVTPPPAPVAQTPAPKAAAPVKLAQAAPQPKETPPAAVAKPPVKQTVAPPPSTPPVSQPVVATKPPTPLGLARPAAVAPPPATPKTELAKATPAPAATKPAAVKAAAGSFLLQVGAYKSEEEATAAWKSYQAKHAALLSGFGPDIQRATVGDKVWYRLRIASFADKDTASAVCDRLKAQNGNCFLAH